MIKVLFDWIQSRYTPDSQLLSILSQHTRRLHFRKDQVVLAPGQSQPDVWFVSGGLLMVYTEDAEHRQHIADFIPAGDFLLDVDSFIFPAQTDYFVQTLEETFVLAVSHNDVQRLYETEPRFRELCLYVKRDYNRSCLRRTLLLTMPPVNRYAEFCSRFPSATITRRQVSNYLGIPYSTLNRIIHSRAVL